MRTPHIDRLAHEGALFERAFHTTPICSPNRASIVTGQYASRHGIIDNVARDAMSHRLPNYHLELQRAGLRDRAHRQVAHGQRRHAAAGLRPLGQLRRPRQANDPMLNHDGQLRAAPRLHHRHHERPRGRVPRAQARQAVVAVLRAQGRAPRRRAGGRRHAAHLGAGRLCRRRAAQGALPRRDVPEEAEHALARGGREAQARVGRSASRCAGERRARSVLEALHSFGAGGDPPARAR